MVLAFLAERIKYAAPGIAGGNNGQLGALSIDGKPIDPKKQHMLRPGGVILMQTPGGGGYGPIENRPKVAKLRDKKMGFV